MRKKFYSFIILCYLISPILSVSQTVPAFPGAEGHGRFTTGGRGGTVYYVTNLSDDNVGNSATREGSLRWCLNQNGTKTILFKVSGTIFLNSSLKITKGNLTIAGQSAPGNGICIAGYPFSIAANNVIIRYLRFRMGDLFNISADGADAFGARGCTNLIIDHCSICWSTDECVSIYENENTTLQWCIISESLRLSKHTKGPHGYGGIWGGYKASFHHNLLAHHDSRTPRFGPGVSTQLNEYVDMRNCVIYNWEGNGCYGAEAMKVNIVNNYYKPGPATPSGSKRGRIIAIDKKTGLLTTDDFSPINNVWGNFFIDGNYIDSSTSTSSSDKNVCNNATNNNWDYGVYNQISSSYGITEDEKLALKMAETFDAGIVTTHSAQIAYEKVLAYAGASLHRDTYDERIVNETATGTAQFKGLSPYNGLGSVTYPAGTQIGSTVLTQTTTIDWKSTAYPKLGIIDSQNDLKPENASDDWSPWPALNSTTSSADNNIDGIPDGWLEEKYPGKNASDTNEEGYTYLEVYLNGIVKEITDNQLEVGDFSNIVSSQGFSPTKVFSNSQNDILFIKSEKRMKSIHLFTPTGISVLSTLIDDFIKQVNIGYLPAGIYIMKVFFQEDIFPFTTKIKISVNQ